MPVEPAIDVEKILALATDRSREARAVLMNTIVDLFLPAEQRLTEQQRALMTEVLGKLIGTIEIDVRQHLVDALLRSPLELPELEAMLANDRIEVARPILERSRVIRDADLIQIVMQRAEEHRLAIAVREGLSADVADALVANGEPDVLDALVRNTDATLSRRAMEYLVAESKRYDRFQEPLLNRSDLPADLAYRMYWWVSAALRRHVLRNFSIDEATLDDAITHATRRGMADGDDAQTAQARAMRLAVRLDELGELNDAFLLQTLRQSRLNLFVAGFAVRAALTFQTAWRVVTDRGFESLILLARAVEMSRSVMTSIVLVLDGIQNSAGTQPSLARDDIAAIYDAVTPDDARRVLRFWQLDPSYREAIDGLESDDA